MGSFFNSIGNFFGSAVSGIGDFLGSNFASLIGTGLQARGSLLAGKQQAQAAAQNAGLLRLQGQVSKAQSIVAASEARRQGSKLISKQLTAFAKAGVEVTGGTPMDVFLDTAGETELEALTILHAGELEGLSAQTGVQAELFKGQSAKISSRFNTASALLGALE